MARVNTNMCLISGNLVRDAELKYTASATPVAHFSVAVNRLGPNNAQEVDYFNCILWGKSAEALSNYLTKGTKVLVKGSMRSRNYEAKDGSKRTAWELVADNYAGVELLGGGQQSGGNNQYGGQYQAQPQPQQRQVNQPQLWHPMTVDELTPEPQPAPRPQEQGDIPF